MIAVLLSVLRKIHTALKPIIRLIVIIPQVDSERYQELKDNMEAEGIEEPLIVYLGKNGVAKIGEGNHRHEIALELGLPKVPVRFIFWKNVYLSEDVKK